MSPKKVPAHSSGGFHTLTLLFTTAQLFFFEPCSAFLAPSTSTPRHGINKHAITTPRLFSSVGDVNGASSEQQDEDAWNLQHPDYDLSLFSPCKINLFLRILRKRPDGFHDLASLFQTIGFGDSLHLKLVDHDDSDVEEGYEDCMECEMPGVPTDKSNLVMRALDLIKRKTGNEKKRFKAKLVKRVPAQAGLGGGSGNAATALYGANKLLGNPATQEQLIEWSGELGSDITFFLSRGTAYCTGRGEILQPVQPPPFSPKMSVTILKPSIGLSTPTVFKALDYDQLSKIDPEDLLDRFLVDSKGGDVGMVAEDKFVNDLEDPAFRVLPELKVLKEDLEGCGFERVLMSGSGTSIFGLGGVEAVGDDKIEVLSKRVRDKFGERDDLNIFEATFINREDGWYEGDIQM